MASSYTKTYKDANQLSLLGSLNRIETPFVTVKIGKYEFGVHKTPANFNHGYIAGDEITYGGTQFPDLITSLVTTKINGTVNQYTLTLRYGIRYGDDPNFVEKVFSSIKNTRKMTLSYGDLSVPAFIYKEEEALVQKVTKQFDMAGACITYTVHGVSSCNLTSGTYTSFPATTEKPSDVIKQLLRQNETYGLLDVFPGMRNSSVWDVFIDGSDEVCQIETKSNISVLDYISYLVSKMIPQGINSNEIQTASYYSFVVYDNTSNTDEALPGIKLDGPYFKIKRADVESVDDATTYVLDVGFPSQTIVTQLVIEDNEGYSILFDYNNKNEYVVRYGDDGKEYSVYSPAVGSHNDRYILRTEDKTWWTQATQYPIKASITIKGLLRPALLMTHVRLNILFYGRKFVDSGLYVITKQIDTIDTNGYRTQLSLQRIGGDEEGETIGA